MRLSKKLLSVILALALVVGSIPTAFSVTSNAYTIPEINKGTTYGINGIQTFDTPSEVDGLTAKIAGDTNIIKGMTYSSKYGTETTYSYTYDNFNNITSGVEKVGQIITGTLPEGHIDINGYKQLIKQEDGTYNYQDFNVLITFSFPVNAKIDAFALVGHDPSKGTARAAAVQEYKLYASTSLESLYTDDSEIYHYTNDEESTDRKTSQYITFAGDITAKYFGIRVIKCMSKYNIPSHYGNETYLRLRQLAVFGEIDLTEENKKPTSAYNAQQCIKDLKTDYNLMQDGYGLATKPDTEGIYFTGGDSENASKSYSTQSYASALDLIDGDVTTHSDVNIKLENDQSLFFLDKNGNFTDGVHFDMIVKLRNKAKIDKLFVVFPSVVTWQASEYFVYTSETYENLFKGEPTKITTRDSVSEPYGTVVFSTPVTAQYVGIKITKGVKNTESIMSGYSNTVTYLRFAEIAIFGKYDIPYYDYTIKPSVDGLFDTISGTKYSGGTDTFSVPIAKDGKTFECFYFDGVTRLDHKLDHKNNLAYATVTLNRDITITAHYSDDPTELALTNGRADAESKTVKVTSGEFVYNLATNANVAYKNIKAVRENEVLSDGTFLKGNDVIQVFANGNKATEYKVQILGDFNDDGALNVTDVVGGINAILNGNATDEQKAIFDVNNDGVLSASDVINARSDILNTPSVTDVDNKTKTMEEIDKKILGRNTANADGSVTIDWAASTIKFNAYCYGDVSVAITATDANSLNYRVFVDGEDTQILAPIRGSKCDMVIAKDLPAGYHTFEIYKQSECLHKATFHSVTLNGQIVNAPKDNDLLIEFVGDSITGGCLNNSDPDGNITPGKVASDASESYGLWTAQKLNADWSIISRGAATLVPSAAGTISAHTSMPEVYNRTIHPSTSNSQLNGNTYKDDESNYWDFKNNRTADIVVVNLGTNDYGVLSKQGITDDAEQRRIFTESAYNFAKDIIAKNGDDTKIVFAFGMMTDQNNKFVSCYKSAMESLKKEGIDVYYCAMPQNNLGGVSHPNIQGHIDAAETLSNFIATNVIGK